MTTHLFNHLTRKGWITSSDFLVALNLCQILPGPNATNLAAFIGWRFKGIWGSILCTFALVLPGAATVLIAARALASISTPSLAHAGLQAVVAGVVGVFLASTLSLSRTVLSDFRTWTAAIATFILVGPLHLPAPVVVAGMVTLLWPRHGADEKGGGHEKSC